MVERDTDMLEDDSIEYSKYVEIRIGNAVEAQKKLVQQKCHK